MVVYSFPIMNAFFIVAESSCQKISVVITSIFYDMEDDALWPFVGSNFLLDFVGFYGPMIIYGS